MGLDWCLKHKPRYGFEADYLGLVNVDDMTDEQTERWKVVSVSPHETLGVPRIGLDEVATRYFVEQIIPSNREAIVRDPSLVERNPEYVSYWQQPDEALLADAHGDYCPDLVDYGLSTVQTAPPFRSLAGAFSFRGKMIGNCELLSEELRGEAYQDLTPPEMADYASRIEAESLVTLSKQVAFVPVRVPDAETARYWADSVRAEAIGRAKTEGFMDDPMLGLSRRGAGNLEFFERTEYEARAEQLLHVLDAARWLRFWADLGHGMLAWY